MHKSSPLAGKTVKIKASPAGSEFGREETEYRVEDYWDLISGQGSWKKGAENGNMACVIYAMRVEMEGLPHNDEVLYGKIGPFGHLIHISEIEQPTECHD